jgi:hypothetical protein
MPKATAKNTTSTNRRALLSKMAAGVAAGATALTLAVVPGLALPVDPIFAAIAVHKETVGKISTENEKLLAAGVDDPDDRPMRGTCS